MANVRYFLVNNHITNWEITMLLVGKLTVSRAIFNSYVKLPKGNVGFSGFIYVGEHGFKQSFNDNDHQQSLGMVVAINGYSRRFVGTTA